MKEFELKYGCNPNQKPSKIYMANGEDPCGELQKRRNGGVEQYAEKRYQPKAG